MSATIGIQIGHVCSLAHEPRARMGLKTTATGDARPAEKKVMPAVSGECDGRPAPKRHQSAKCVDSTIPLNERSDRTQPGLSFPNVRDRSLREIRTESAGFNHYRIGWINPPCRRCDNNEEDLGGSRGQTWLLAGDADAADPVCPKSPHREIVSAALKKAANPDRYAQPIIFRDPKESRRLIKETEASESSA